MTRASVGSRSDFTRLRVVHPLHAPQPRVSGPRVLVIGLLLLALGGCAGRLEGVGYLWQSVSGHLSLMRAARPIAEVIGDPATEPDTADKLRYAHEARAFAARSLALPANGSYTRYAALDRRFVLWNVFATPELSLSLERWCFPVAGCIVYRGYYDEADARSFAAGLAQQGMDVRVGGVPAYSTLGWFDDPIPSSVIRFPKMEIARLVFHELAHQVVYLPGDTTFNESFATAVEKLGIERWILLRDAGGTEAGEIRRYRLFSQRKAEFLALLREARSRLDGVYASDAPVQAMRAGKAEVFVWLRAEYERVKRDQWGGWPGYDAWFDQPLGNAHLAAIGAYHDRVGAFTALFEAEGRDFTRFYAAVRELAGMPAGQRNARLDALGGCCPTAMAGGS